MYYSNLMQTKRSSSIGTWCTIIPLSCKVSIVSMTPMVKSRRFVRLAATNPARPGDVHREGGGFDQEVVVFFNIRGHDGVLYEVLDDDQNIIDTLSYVDFLGLYKAQQG